MDRLVRTPSSLLSFLTVGLFVNHAVPPLSIGGGNVDCPVAWSRGEE